MTQVLLSGDTIIFDAAFGVAILMPPPTAVARGSAHTTSSGAALVYESDVRGLPPQHTIYSIPGATTPGTGAVRITGLDSTQLSHVFRDNGKPVVLATGTFTAELSVTVGAFIGTTQDPKKRYSGGGVFKIMGTRPDVT